MEQDKQVEGYKTKLRRAAIKRLVSTRRIATQNELSQILEEEGFRSTQATISRDIRELRLIKLSDSKGKYYTYPERSDELVASDQFKSMYRNLVIRTDRANNLIVIHTSSGMAQALCATMDRMAWNGILGTIAGDDTVLLIAADNAVAEEIVEALSGI